MYVVCMCSTHFHSLCIVEHAMSNLLATAMMEPLSDSPPLRSSATWRYPPNADFSINLFCLGHDRMPPCWRHPQTPSSAQTGTPNFDPFFSCLFMIVTCKKMTIKHLLDMSKVPSLSTEMACVVFFHFQNSL